MVVESCVPTLPPCTCLRGASRGTVDASVEPTPSKVVVTSAVSWASFFLAAGLAFFFGGIAVGLRAMLLFWWACGGWVGEGERLDE